MQTTKNLGKIDSVILAEFILQNYGSMSHLKLQKLLFYVEALHLAYFDASIIDDDFQAWLHGPVSRKLYDAVKGQSVLYTEVNYVNEGGDNPTKILHETLTGEQLEILEQVLKEYSKLSSYELESLTHTELPWLEARQGVPYGDRCENVISKETMRSFYKKEMFPY